MPEEKFPAFLTGSHAYGIPTEKSDVDIVVFMTREELDQLNAIVTSPVDWEPLGGTGEDGNDYSKNCHTHSFRFGKLNLLVCTDEKSYNVWAKGTRRLKRRKPVPRDFAVNFLGQLREKELG